MTDSENAWRDWRAARDAIDETIAPELAKDVHVCDPQIAAVEFEWEMEDREFVLIRAVDDQGADVSQRLWGHESDDDELAMQIMNHRGALKICYPSSDFIRVDLRTLTIESR